MLALFFTLFTFYKVAAEVTTEGVKYLNELPLDKLLLLKSSLQEIVTTPIFDNVTSTPPSYLQSFGAQAMAIQGPPVKRADYEEALYKKESKISNIFSMSVTTLAFLAFGGYLLCLIVQAVKAKQGSAYPTQQPTTLFVSAGLKKKPQAQFASYGRRRRDNRFQNSFDDIDLPPEELFDVLLKLCESYAKWSEGNDDLGL